MPILKRLRGRDDERSAALAHLAAQRARFAAQADGSAASSDLAGQQALASLCHVLLNLNEFIYVD